MAALSFTFVQYLLTDISLAIISSKKDDTNTSLSFSSRTSLWYNKRLFYLITNQNNRVSFNSRSIYAPGNFAKAMWLFEISVFFEKIGLVNISGS